MQVSQLRGNAILRCCCRECGGHACFMIVFYIYSNKYNKDFVRNGKTGTNKTTLEIYFRQNSFLSETLRYCLKQFLYLIPEKKEKNEDVY